MAKPALKRSHSPGSRHRPTLGTAGRPLDVDNVAKTIIDAFCSWQIARDGSATRC
jgi:hypothetical protein